MNFFILYFLSYFLTYLGFPLGKSTLEEHKEIKKIVFKYLEIIMFIFYIILLGLIIIFNKNITLISSNISIIIILIGIISYYIFSLKHKKKYFLEFHEILIYSFAIVLLKKFFEEYIFLILIIIFYIIGKNSFKKGNIKEEIYKLIILSVLFIIFDFLFK